MAIKVIGPSWLPTGTLLWSKGGLNTMTVVCKATYHLRAPRCQLAEEQDALNERDNHWNDDSERSVQAPSDIVPFKPLTEVLVVGAAFAPEKKPTRSFVARVAVGTVDKSMEVVCDQTIAPNGALQCGAPITRMSLLYERAARSAKNPVGVRVEPSDSSGRVVLPNIRSRAGSSSRAGGEGAALETPGFGPIALAWPERMQHVPASVSPPHELDLTREPIPEGINLAYFCSAPPEQRLKSIAPDEAIRLECLHPDFATFVTCLSGDRVSARVERESGPAEELRMWIDTLWIATDRLICTVTWRGFLPLRQRDEIASIVIEFHQKGAPSVRPVGADETAILSAGGALLPGSGAPSSARSGDESKPPKVGESTARSVAVVNTPALPFVPPPNNGPGRLSPVSSASSGAPAPPIPRSSTDTQELSAIVAGLLGRSLPFSESNVAGEGGAGASSAPISSAWSAPPSPASVASPPASVASPPASVASPPAHPPRELLPPPVVAPPPLFGALPEPRVSLSVAKGSVEPGSVQLPARSSEGGTKARSSKPQVARVSALAGKRSAANSAMAFSNAAAQGSEPPSGASPALQPDAAKPTSERALRPCVPVELLWVDAAFIEPIRRQPEWRALLASLEPAPDAKASKEAEASSKGTSGAGSGSDVPRVLALGTPLDGSAVSISAMDAIDEYGVFTPPLVLVDGEFALALEEIEELKAVVTMVTPFVGVDKRLRDVIDSVNEAMKAPLLQTVPGIAKKLLDQVKEAYVQAPRALSLKDIEVQAERVVTDQRCYQKRTVVGQPCIRALLLLSGGAVPIPAYLPASAGRDLPIYSRMRVRLVAEVRFQLDQYESNPHALRVVALGRVLPSGGR